MSESDGNILAAQFRELQQEKKKLQNRLDHFRFRRKDLESKHNSVSEKNNLLNQKHDNMSRTTQIAKRKVKESQVHVEKLQTENDEYQSRITLMKEGLRKEEEAKDNYLLELQSKFDELSKDFRGAKRFYNNESLDGEIEHWKTICRERKLNIDTGNELVTSISSQLENLHLKKETDEKPDKTSWCDVVELNPVLSTLIIEESSKMDTLVDSEQKRTIELNNRTTLLDKEAKQKCDQLAQLQSC